MEGGGGSDIKRFLYELFVPIVVGGSFARFDSLAPTALVRKLIPELIFWSKPGAPCGVQDPRISENTSGSEPWGMRTC